MTIDRKNTIRTMENAAKQNLGKHHVVKILIFLSLIAMWQVRQLGSTFSSEYTKQLRVTAHHSHEHAARHSVDGDSGAASSDEETEDTAEGSVDTDLSPVDDAADSDGSGLDPMDNARSDGMSTGETSVPGTNENASEIIQADEEQDDPGSGPSLAIPNTPASENNETETEVKNDEEEEDHSEVEDLSPSKSEASNGTLAKTDETEIDVKSNKEEEDNSEEEDLSQSNSEASNATHVSNTETEIEAQNNGEEKYDDDAFYVEEEEDHSEVKEDEDNSEVEDLSPQNSEESDATLVSKTKETEIEDKINEEEEEEDDNSEVEEEEDNSEVEDLVPSNFEPSNATLVSKTKETEIEDKSNEEEEEEDDNSEVEEEEDNSEVEDLFPSNFEPSKASLASKIKETETEVKNDEEEENNSEVEDLSPSKSKASEVTIASYFIKANSTSSSNETEVTSDSKNEASSTTDPIFSTNANLTAKMNTGSQKPQARPLISANKTDSPGASMKNSTESSEETMENDSSSLLAVGDETEAGNEPTPEEKQLALWQAAKEQFDATKPWKNKTTFTTVDREVYQDIVEKAKVSVKSVLEDVYTGCELYILPTADDNPSEKLRVQYKCLGDENPTLQDDICHTVNMCKVVMDEEAWKQAGTAVSSNTSTTNKSDLLTMVDSVENMMNTKIFKGIINKASYAYRSNRSFYIWIGNLDQNELNRREVETLGPSFGFRCAVREITNSIHHYKPIAFLVLFDILKSSSPGTESIFYSDADAAFTRTAFERIDNDKFNGTTTDSENLLGPIGPEAYLGLSPQASLMATTNPNGSSLMNSGVMLFRNTRWSRDFMALWWYGRCGGQDQLSLWLMLYATFSAWTANEVESAQFAYPGEIFFDFTSAKNKLFMHFRQSAHPLQDAWKTTIERRREEKSKSDIEKDDEDDYAYPGPTNTELYNGGSAGGSLGKKLFGPLELPQVVVLSPISSVSYNTTIEGASKDQEGLIVEVNLPKLRAEVGDDSFVVHSKNIDSCSDWRCWPYAEK